MRITIIALYAMLTVGLVGLTGCGDSAAPTKVSGTKAAAPAVWLTDFAAAKAKAKKEGKPILADFTGSDWCGWCMKLKEEVFETKEFNDWAAKNVVLLEVDFPQSSPQPEALRQQNTGLAETYKVSGFPSILFLDADGTKLGETGYVAGGPDEWLPTAQQALGSK